MAYGETQGKCGNIMLKLQIFLKSLWCSIFHEREQKRVQFVEGKVYTQCTKCGSIHCNG